MKDYLQAKEKKSKYLPKNKKQSWTRFHILHKPTWAEK